MIVLMVELGGFEPPASAMSMLRSNQLSYNSRIYKLRIIYLAFMSIGQDVL